MTLSRNLSNLICFRFGEDVVDHKNFLFPNEGRSASENTLQCNICLLDPVGLLYTNFPVVLWNLDFSLSNSRMTKRLFNYRSIRFLTEFRAKLIPEAAIVSWWTAGVCSAAQTIMAPPVRRQSGSQGGRDIGGCHLNVYLWLTRKTFLCWTPCWTWAVCSSSSLWLSPLSDLLAMGKKWETQRM